MRRILSCVVLVAATLGLRANETPDVKLAPAEERLFDLLNRERKKEKLGELTVHPILTKAARQHAENMARQEKFSHELDGKSVAQRVRDLNYDYRIVGENLALAEAEKGDDPPPPTAAEIHQKWMESKGHRAHILNGKYREVGLAITRDRKGTYYYVQVFAASRR